MEIGSDPAHAPWVLHNGDLRSCQCFDLLYENIETINIRYTNLKIVEINILYVQTMRIKLFWADTYRNKVISTIKQSDGKCSPKSTFDYFLLWIYFIVGLKKKIKKLILEIDRHIGRCRIRIYIFFTRLFKHTFPHFERWKGTRAHTLAWRHTYVAFFLRDGLHGWHC